MQKSNNSVTECNNIKQSPPTAGSNCSPATLSIGQVFPWECHSLFQHRYLFSNIVSMSYRDSSAKYQKSTSHYGTCDMYSEIPLNESQIMSQHKVNKYRVFVFLSSRGTASGILNLDFIHPLLQDQLGSVYGIYERSSYIKVSLSPSGFIVQRHLAKLCVQKDIDSRSLIGYPHTHRKANAYMPAPTSLIVM